MNAINFADFLTLDPNAKAFWHLVLFLFTLLVLYKMITGGDFAAKVLGVAVILFGIWFLSGCTPDLGVTERARIYADAKVSVAQADRDARIGVAQAQADGVARAAHATADAQRQSAQAWAGMIPFALLVIGATVVIAIVVSYQGKLYLARTQQPYMLPTATTAHRMTLDTNKLRLLHEHAQRRNMRVIEDNGQYYLTDGQRTIKALLKG